MDRLTAVFPVLCQGIIRRDEIVFRAARRRGIPILMVTSGGYQKKTARIIADSIINLHQQGLIGAESLEGEGSSSLVTALMRSTVSAGSQFTAVWWSCTNRFMLVCHVCTSSVLVWNTAYLHLQIVNTHSLFLIITYFANRTVRLLNHCEAYALSWILMINYDQLEKEKFYV